MHSLSMLGEHSPVSILCIWGCSLKGETDGEPPTTSGLRACLLQEAFLGAPHSWAPSRSSPFPCVTIGERSLPLWLFQGMFLSWGLRAPQV